MPAGKFWTSAEIKRFRECYADIDMSIDDMIWIFGRTRKAIVRQANKLGLKRPNKFIEIAKRHQPHCYNWVRQ